MSLRTSMIFDKAVNPPESVEKWLEHLPNESFFKVYFLAKAFNGNRDFERLSPEEQGKLCAEVLSEVIDSFILSKYGDQWGLKIVEQEYAMEECSTHSHLWSYTAPDKNN